MFDFRIETPPSDDHPRSAMNTFKTGPPGGKTIPPTAVKLSDLAGGIYGPGASVASTGLNSQRPVVKAASSHAAGDTWEDVLEYYLVRMGVIAGVTWVTRIPLVQCRQRRDGFRVSTWEDLLPWFTIPVTRGYSFRK